MSASDTARPGAIRAGFSCTAQRYNMNYPREVQKRLNFPDCAVNRSSSI
jgi:hypothetical protein